jgi:hypothetical protein
MTPKPFNYFTLLVLSLVSSMVSAQTMPDLPPIDLDHSYGAECGFTRIIPAYRDSIEALVKHKKLIDIERWLMSDEDVKTVYAIEALYRLKNELIIGEEQMAIIRHYMENDVPIICCGRGIPENCSSKEVLRSFEF